MKLTSSNWIRPTLAVLVAALIVGLLYDWTRTTPSKQPAESCASTAFSAMSTVVSVQLYHPEAQYDFAPAFAAVREEFAAAASVCNFFDSSSELSRLNRSAATAAFPCSEALWELLTASRMYYRKTGGAFDVTVSPLLDLWGFYKKQNAVPAPEAIAAAKQKVGMDKIEFDDAAHTVRFTVPGMAVNLGGIAKGWTLDRARRRLERQFGITKGFLNAGGNVLVFGGEFTGGIQNPFDSKQICGKVTLTGSKAIATSGAYERFVVIDDREYGHIMNPQTGYPADTFFSATVIADSGLASDALSTSFYLCGMELQAQFPDVPVLLIGRRKNHPELTEVQQSGDCWELNVPEQVPQKNPATPLLRKN